MKQFVTGERVQITYAVDGPDGPVDPEDLRIVLVGRFQDPQVFIHGQHPEVTRESAGRYLFESADLPAGEYRYEWKARGNVQDTLRGPRFEIRQELPEE